MANEYKLGNKLQLQNGFAMTLGRAAADPGSPVAGDQYYNTVSNVIRFYNGTVWADVSASTAGFATTELDNLTTTSINADLLPDGDATRVLGAASLRWDVAFLNQIQDSASNTVMSASSRTLNDSSNAVSLDFENRQLRSGATVKLDYSGTDLDVNTRKIINLADPTSGQDAATKVYVDNLAQGLKPKQAVRAATTVNGTLATAFANGQVIDGVTLATGNRILIKNQTTTSQNGIYIVQASGAPVRSTDFDSVSPIDEINGAYVATQEGTTQQGQVFVQQGTVTTIGTDPIIFVFFSSATGANVSLSNLSAVAINTALLPGVDGTINLGSGAKRFLDIFAESMKDASGVVVLDVVNRILKDSTAVGSVDAEDRLLLDSAGVNSIAYDSRLLYDSAGIGSMDYNARVLANNSGSSKIAFSGANNILRQTTLQRAESESGVNYVEQQYIDSVTLTANTTVTVTSYAGASFEGAIIDYKLKQATSGNTRSGQFIIANNGTTSVSGAGPYTETADAEIILSADINSGNIRLRAQNTNATLACTMRLDIKRLRT